MKTKKSIVLLYLGVGVISALLILGFVTLGNLYDLRTEASKPPLEEVGKDYPTEFLTLQTDLQLINQDGEAFSVFDLKDKVWIFAQFFAKCPQCAERNYSDLSGFYKQYKDHPDFVIVCMTIDPETDQVERLKEYAEVVGAETEDWLFLTGKKEELHRYMKDEMKFLDVRERQDPLEIATKGRYAHDLGIAVFDKGLKMIMKRDLSFARTQNDDLVELYQDDLTTALERALASEESK